MHDFGRVVQLRYLCGGVDPARELVKAFVVVPRAPQHHDGKRRPVDRRVIPIHNLPWLADCVERLGKYVQVVIEPARQLGGSERNHLERKLLLLLARGLVVLHASAWHW